MVFHHFHYFLGGVCYFSQSSITHGEDRTNPSPKEREKLSCKVDVYWKQHLQKALTRFGTQTLPQTESKAACMLESLGAKDKWKQTRTPSYPARSNSARHWSRHVSFTYYIPSSSCSGELLKCWGLHSLCQFTVMLSIVLVFKFYHILTEGKIKILLFILPRNERSHDIHFLEVS